MPTMISISTGENVITCYYQDGTSRVLDAGTEHVMELAADKFVTISDAPESEQNGPVFADVMIKFWTWIRDTATAHGKELPTIKATLNAVETGSDTMG